MPIAPMARLLKHASDNGYAVGAFVCMNLEVIQAAIAAAEAENSPVVIRIHPDCRQITRFDTLTTIAKHLAAEARVPVGLSLDHGATLADTVDAIRAGCTSVMIDSEDSPLDTNLALTREVVKVAESLGVLVETAIGHMEHGAVQNENDLADVAQSVRLIKESGAAILAPAIGNVHGSAHGEVKATPELAIDRIRELREATGVPICMHGGSGTPPAMMKQAVGAGVAMVILFSDIITAFNKEMRTVYDKNSDGIAIIDALVPAQHAAQRVIAEKMSDLGSKGQGEAFIRWLGTQG